MRKLTEDDTDNILIEHCAYHADHHTRIKRNEDDIQRLWRETGIMKTWVICGMASLILEIGIIILTRIVH